MNIGVILQVYIWNTFYELLSWALPVKVVPGEWHITPLVISQHCFRQLFAAIKQQAIIWANVEPDFCDRIASLGHNDVW